MPRGHNQQLENANRTALNQTGPRRALNKVINFLRTCLAPDRPTLAKVGLQLAKPSAEPMPIHLPISGAHSGYQ